MQEILIKPKDVKAKVIHIGQSGEFAYLELILGPIKQRGYTARARLTKDERPWVEITPPQQKGADGKSHILSFIEGPELWKQLLEILTKAYLQAIEESDNTLEGAADYNCRKDDSL